ncbi:hypothetical protein AVEN_210940-1 [Araneus ventricosus]|uniref:Uncharacterized protein n=1 Tax=Araneus ventricosus TaxID=182803 RepID=A0A4Y2DF49_ARAVE|nr:hypothetical protein AVEN_210940-1 [Araneus ventricosus]
MDPLGYSPVSLLDKTALTTALTQFREFRRIVIGIFCNRLLGLRNSNYRRRKSVPILPCASFVSAFPFTIGLSTVQVGRDQVAQSTNGSRNQGSQTTRQTKSSGSNRDQTEEMSI